MMHTLGIDLTDEYIALSEAGKDPCVFPAVISAAKDGSAFYTGEEAYREALSGRAVMTDSLLRLLEKDGTSTIGGTVYPAQSLLSKLLSALIREYSGAEPREFDRLCICLSEPEKSLMDRVAGCAVLAGADPQKLVISGHEEAFAFYALSLDRKLSAGNLCLFDLGKDTLFYYEFGTTRGRNVTSAAVGSERLEEAFQTDILKTESGRELADRILTDAAGRLTAGKNFSAAFLTGSGFSETDWARSFLSMLGRRRRVLLEEGLFAIGARLIAEDEETEGEKPLIFCDTRVAGELSTEVLLQGFTKKLVLVSPGDRWHGLRAFVELLPKGQDYIEICVMPFGRDQEKHTERLSLDGFPKRPEGTTKLKLSLSFHDHASFRAELKDLGFGELFPASDSKTEKDITI